MSNFIDRLVGTDINLWKLETVEGGRPAAAVISIREDSHLMPISAAHALAARGLELAAAKNAIETMIEHGSCTVGLSDLDCPDKLRCVLEASGVKLFVSGWMKGNADAA